YVLQFGSVLYEMFFRRYSEKVWGRPCEELSADWVSQRSRGFSIWTLVRESLLGKDKEVVSLIDSFMYPRDGYGRIPERMAEDVRNRGSEVLLGAQVTRIAYHGAHDIEVTYRRDGEESSVRANAVVSTVPLGLLVQMLTPGCDQAVTDAARNLAFRDLITVNAIFRRNQISQDTWLSVQDESVMVGRLREPKNWSVAMVPDDEHTSVVLECFCSRGDAVWRMSDAEIVERCLKDLTESLGFARREEFEEAVVVRTTHAYPVYDLEYARKLDVIRTFLGRYEGLHIVGRGGTFPYHHAGHHNARELTLGRRL